MSEIRQIPMCQTILDHVINSRGYSAPGAVKELRHMFPGQEPGPCTQEMGESICEPMFASTPREVFNLDAAMLTSYSPRSVSEPYRNAPKGNMAKMTNRESIPILGSASTAAAKEQLASIREDIHDEFVCVALDLTDTKSLKIQRGFDQLGNKHEFLLGSRCVW